jgi:hypothetical protein
MSDEIWEKVETVAKHRGVPDSTVRVWKHRKAVPPYRRDEIVDGALEIGVKLTYEDLKTIQ